MDSSGASKLSGDMMVPALMAVWLGKKLSGCSEVTGNWHVWTAQDFSLLLPMSCWPSNRDQEEKLRPCSFHGLCPFVTFWTSGESGFLGAEAGPQQSAVHLNARPTGILPVRPHCPEATWWTFSLPFPQEEFVVRRPAKGHAGLHFHSRQDTIVSLSVLLTLLLSSCPHSPYKGLWHPSRVHFCSHDTSISLMERAGHLCRVLSCQPVMHNANPWSSIEDRMKCVNGVRDGIKWSIPFRPSESSIVLCSGG